MKTNQIALAIAILAVGVVFIYFTVTTGNSIYPTIFLGLLFIFFGITNYRKSRNK